MSVTVTLSTSTVGGVALVVAGIVPTPAICAVSVPPAARVCPAPGSRDPGRVSSTRLGDTGVRRSPVDAMVEASVTYPLASKMTSTDPAQMTTGCSCPTLRPLTWSCRRTGCSGTHGSSSSVSSLSPGPGTSLADGADERCHSARLRCPAGDGRTAHEPGAADRRTTRNGTPCAPERKPT